jgi:hypothetical protein
VAYSCYTPPVLDLTQPPWPDSTVVCIASGPSLLAADVERCRGLRVLAVSNAIALCPWADAHYAADCKWWDWHEDLANAPHPPKFSVSGIVKRKYFRTIQHLIIAGSVGLDYRPTHVMTGGHSGYTAINLAMHLGARRIILLGYDMQRGPQGEEHFFGDHPDRTHLAYTARCKAYASLLRYLTPRGISIVNATRETAIPDTYVPRLSLEAVLSAV